MSGPVPAVAVEDVTFAYGHLQVLHGVTAAVPVAGRVALLGTNGAGKSTLLRVVAGLLRPARGRVLLDGEDVTRLSPADRVRRGLTLVEGGRATFPTLTVAENLSLGAYQLARRSLPRRVDDALELFPALRPRLDQRAGTLSGGEQQMLALARAAVARPRTLLVDELSLGLAPVVMQQVADAVGEMTRRGVTLLLVEQSLNVAMALSEHAFFLEKGEVAFSGPTTDLLDRGDLVRAVFFGAAPAAR